MTCKMLCAGPGPQWTCNGHRLLFNFVLVKLYGNLTRTSSLSIWIIAHTPGEHSSMAMESQAGDHRLDMGGGERQEVIWLYFYIWKVYLLQPSRVMTWLQCSGIFSMVCWVFHILYSPRREIQTSSTCFLNVSLNLPRLTYSVW